MLEMKVVLSRLLVFYQFSLAQDPASVTYDISLTLPIKGIRFEFRFCCFIILSFYLLGGLKVSVKPLQL